MPRPPNYNFEKRQKDLARQKKKEEKLQKKSQKKENPEAGTEGGVPIEGVPVPE